MGVIRKTVSVGTLGMVSWRSKKERLRRAEKSQRRAEISLTEEHKARVNAEERISAAEKRVKKASAEATHAAKHRSQRRTAPPMEFADVLLEAALVAVIYDEVEGLLMFPNFDTLDELFGRGAFVRA